jgi:hypothetical protein
MSLLRTLPLLALALVMLPTARAADTPTKDDDEVTMTGKVIEVQKDGTLFIELIPAKRDLIRPTIRVRTNVKTDNNTKFTKTTKNQDGTQTQSQAQQSDVKKGDTVNIKMKGKGTPNKKATSVNINNTNNPNPTTNPTK